VLAALRVPVLEKEGFEADDVIATLTRQAVAQGFEVVVSSGDRDALQLVSGDVTLLYPVRGVSDLIRMTPEVVQERYGVPPQRYPRSPPSSARAATTCPACPASATRPPPSG
jgi:DNA polymerase-1